MAEHTTPRSWLLDFEWAQRPGPEVLPARAGITLWRSLDGVHGRARLEAEAAPAASWQALDCIVHLTGASAASMPTHHYAVETDIPALNEADFNAWYQNEHLPGLARVPGTIAAWRFTRRSGAPRYIACYDLSSDSVLETPEWLAVRATDWSARVRPHFMNTRRTMFVAVKEG